MLPTIAILALSFFFQTPDTTVSAHAEYTVRGRGVQIYKCTAKDNAFNWTFQQPEATLFDAASKQLVGLHTGGPTWTWTDSSAIVGKLLRSKPSPDPANIPWLLLETHSAGETGALSNIKFVRRSDTQGGVAPTTGCDAEHQDNAVRVTYEATYTFYSAN
jgi:hypothetical protein